MDSDHDNQRFFGKDRAYCGFVNYRFLLVVSVLPDEYVFRVTFFDFSKSSVGLTNDWCYSGFTGFSFVH